MRRLAVMLSLAVAAGGCGKGGSELQPAEDAGRFSSKPDVEKFFADRANAGTTFDEIKQNFEYEGSVACKGVKATLKFKGESAGLWVQGDMTGAIDASTCDAVMRFYGTVNGPVTVRKGVIWMEKLPDKTWPKYRLTMKEQTTLVLNTATKEQIQQLPLKWLGGPAEVVVFECDCEPGRYKVPWGNERGGITVLQVFSKLEAAPPGP